MTDFDQLRDDLDAIGKSNVDAMLDAANRANPADRERIFAALRAEPPAVRIVAGWCDRCEATIALDEPCYMTSREGEVVARHCERCGPPWGKG